ncbi:MAG: CocE/NonD family hydrolase [Halobacteriales archaeon]
MGTRSVGEEITRHDELLIPVASETVSATRYEPTGVDSPRPTVLVYTPYRKDDGPADGGRIVRNLVPAGYDVVVADLVGTGGSSGVKEEPFTAEEGREAATIVEWLADREWSTGRVGMTGWSYAGLTALRAAIENPDPLGAIVPIVAPFSIYERRGVSTNSHFTGGTLSYVAGCHWLPFMHALQALPPSRLDPEGRWSEVWDERLEGLREGTPWLFQYLDHESPKDAYWESKDVTPEDVRGIEAPTFLATGWRDSFVHANTHYFQYLDAPKRLLVGPWRHDIPDEGREVTVDFWAQVIEWFDRFLAGAENGAREWPTITYWTEREGGGVPNGGIWRGREAWPDTGTAPDTLSFALSPGGLVRTDAYESGAVEREYDHDHTVGIESSDRHGPPLDTNADDARLVTFETPPFGTPVELTGSGRATVRVAATTPDPLLAVRLVDVAPDGTARLVTYGHVRASHRHGHDQPEPLDPDEEYTLDVPLRPTSHVVEAGHRLRVAISAALFPLMLPTREQGRFTVRSTPADPSTLAFPGAEHTGGYSRSSGTGREEPLGFDDTVDRDLGTGDPVTDPPAGATLETTREHLSNRATFRESSDTRSEFVYGDAVTTEREMAATVRASDPGTAAFHAETERRLDYPDRCVRVTQSSRVSRDLAQLSVTVTLDDRTVFDETWTRHRPL